MAITDCGSDLSRRVREFVLDGFHPHFGERSKDFPSRSVWGRLRELGTELWLDTGDISQIRELWTREFTALTTNNTLLAAEVRKGAYDAFIREAWQLLEGLPLGEQERKLEMAFILNARHSLRLVELFDAHVSVELHTDLSHDLERTVQYARRYHEICPQRFIVKIPFSPEGVLATRRVSDLGIPINHTLGFSARQNYVIARIGRPAFVNVFLGRLNSFVADNGLGSGAYVGERATLASQAQIAELRDRRRLATRQIAASMRGGRQVIDLAGVDVMTMPPKAAKQFLDEQVEPGDLENRSGRHYEIGLDKPASLDEAGLGTLWELQPREIACLDELENEDLSGMTGEDLVCFFERHECGDVFVRWTQQQIRTSAEEGKIPRLENWRDELQSGRVGLDALMNLAGWNSFDADQREMDHHVLKTAGQTAGHKA